MKISINKHPLNKFSSKLVNKRVNTEGNQPSYFNSQKSKVKVMAGRRINTQNQPETMKQKNRKYILKKSQNIDSNKQERFTYTNQSGLSNRFYNNDFTTKTSYNQHGWRGSLNVNQKLKKYRLKQQDQSFFYNNQSNIQDNSKLKQINYLNQGNIFQNNCIDNKVRDSYKSSDTNKQNMHKKVTMKIKDQLLGRDESKKKLMIVNNKRQRNTRNITDKNCQENYKQLLKNKKNLSIDDFNIIKLIGAGTFGKVYNASYKETGIVVAIKKVHNDKNYKNRQIQLMRVVNSSFVIRQLADFVTHELQDNQGIQQVKQYYHFVMPTYSANLYEYLHKTKIHGKIPNLDIKIFLYQIFRGLLYLHSRNICHRDLKPQNILISQNKNLVLCDLGSAKILNKGESNIAYICSRCYRAPQLIFGNTEYTFSIDIWSAGCIILEILNGYPLFVGKDSLQHLVQVIKVMGTPSKEQILQMNPEYDVKKFSVPKIPKKHWNQIFPRIDNQLISLLNNIMVYSPNYRLNAAQILTHSYFDQLRQQNIFKNISKYLNTSNFFTFDHYQLKYAKNADKLIPKWCRSNY